MRRRVFLASAASALAPAQTDTPRRFIYKRAAGCEIKADVFGPAEGPVGPVVNSIAYRLVVSGGSAGGYLSNIAVSEQERIDCNAAALLKEHV